jgi:HD-like signal output (HDOD) protein
VARLLARDPALAAKVLRTANSGYFGFPRTVSDLHEAVVLLGTETVQALVLAAQIYACLCTVGGDLDGLWAHSMRVSALAREIALRAEGDRHAASLSAVAGLLHDLGQLVLMSRAPSEYADLVRRADGDEVALLCREHERFGLGHPELGAYLLALWGLAPSVLDAVAYHHAWPDPAPGHVPLPMKAVYGAEWCLREAASRDPAGRPRRAPARRPRTGSASLARWRQEMDALVEASLLHLGAD